jgi:parvulin-like peptidyl-prolyl isomerase
MQKHIKLSGSFSILFFIVGLVISGCGPCPLSKKEKVVAYVNKEPIFASELKRHLAIKSRLDPDFKITPQVERDQLDALIEQKLIIQEAIDRGVADNESFINSIKAFWEQTLIREFMDYKKREYEKYLYATTEEIEQYYSLAGQRMTFSVLSSQDERYIKKISNQIRSNTLKEPPAWETIGPISYEAITSEPLKKAFTLPVGEIAVMERAPNYYLIKVENRESINLPPLREIRGDIEKRILTLKEQQLFNEWLQKKKEKTAIKIMKK